MKLMVPNAGKSNVLLKRDSSYIYREDRRFNSSKKVVLTPEVLMRCLIGWSYSSSCDFWANKTEPKYVLKVDGHEPNYDFKRDLSNLLKAEVTRAVWIRLMFAVSYIADHVTHLKDLEGIETAEDLVDHIDSWINNKHTLGKICSTPNIISAFLADRSGTGGTEEEEKSHADFVQLAHDQDKFYDDLILELKTAAQEKNAEEFKKLTTVKVLNISGFITFGMSVIESTYSSIRYDHFYKKSVFSSLSWSLNVEIDRFFDNVTDLAKMRFAANMLDQLESIEGLSEDSGIAAIRKEWTLFMNKHNKDVSYEHILKKYILQLLAALVTEVDLMLDTDKRIVTSLMPKK